MLGLLYLHFKIVKNGLVFVKTVPRDPLPPVSASSLLLLVKPQHSYALKGLRRHLPDCRNVNAMALIIGFYTHRLAREQWSVCSS
ncbi:Exocyst complex component SEC5B [Clarias magur]|uniref:Exocyst complex component SEC5B n=1 Tax=Clarias magur TaxID=1594786 RepID=A0A8J4UTI4_CLAMG|nr:Exocyst complex component SEC5B [Clarias magur]